jgi:phosphatidylserine decarboxylase
LGTGKQGWFGPTGVKDVTEVANKALGTSLTFEEFYVCDPKAKHHGYSSWDGKVTFISAHILETHIRP